MPQLIADIGGTSSRWTVITEGKEPSAPWLLPGFNPAVGQPAPMQQALREAAPISGDGKDWTVWAYAAGCGTPQRAARMRTALEALWPKARVEVRSDLLGAARGLYAGKACLVLILGTGMNAGGYDGENLHTPMPSLGHILGDEGSGADIGKQLLRDALYGLLPPPLEARLFGKPLQVAQVLEQMRLSPSPQAYLASFTAALAPHVQHPYAQELVRSRFRVLGRVLQHFFAQDADRPVLVTGSVAVGFQELLARTLEQVGFRVEAVEPDIMPGLVRYHR